MKVILIALVFYLTTVLSNGDVVKDKRDAEDKAEDQPLLTDRDDDKPLPLTNKQSEGTEQRELETRLRGKGRGMFHQHTKPRGPRQTPDEEQPTVIQQKHALTDDVEVSKIKKRAPAEMPISWTRSLKNKRETRMGNDHIHQPKIIWT
ncbi:hypothetical protein CHUAL_001121 [Chamberlinius hualienensis]